MRMLVCGSRDWKDRERLERALDVIRKNESEPIEVVIEGEAPGADTMAREWAESRGIRVERYPAQWRDAKGYYNPKAGPERNQQMLDEGKPDIVVAFLLPHSKGTYDMVRRAIEAGIPVLTR